MTDDYDNVLCNYDLEIVQKLIHLYVKHQRQFTNIATNQLRVYLEHLR